MVEFIRVITDKPPAWILGSGEGHDHGMISQMPSLTSLIARETGPKAFQMAGVIHDDFDLAMNTTPLPILPS